jgi:hypothetical protein
MILHFFPFRLILPSVGVKVYSNSHFTFSAHMNNGVTCRAERQCLSLQASWLARLQRLKCRFLFQFKGQPELNTYFEFLFHALPASHSNNSHNNHLTL